MSDSIAETPLTSIDVIFMIFRFHWLRIHISK